MDVYVRLRASNKEKEEDDASAKRCDCNQRVLIPNTVKYHQSCSSNGKIKH